MLNACGHLWKKQMRLLELALLDHGVNGKGVKLVDFFGQQTNKNKNKRFEVNSLVYIRLDRHIHTNWLLQ